jgi:hypothetical protein
MRTDVGADGYWIPWMHRRDHHNDNGNATFIVAMVSQHPRYLFTCT